jgi:hypothetical protein
MAGILGDVFNIPEWDATEPFTNEKYRPIFEGWMKGTGPAHLFIYYQKPYKITE